MAIIGRSHSWQNPLIGPVRPKPSEAMRAGPGVRKWRLTLFFVITAVVTMTLVSFIANRVIGGLAEDNLIRMVEENNSRNAEHIQSMMRSMVATDGQDSMPGMSSAGATNDGNSMPTCNSPGR